MSNIKKAKDWYEDSYKSLNFSAQRRYPNEEFLRFMGRNYFNISREKRKKVNVLEIGAGSCSNLWMVALEGFNAYGIDFSKQAIKLGKEMLNHWKVKAKLQVASMTELPYSDNSFDVVADIFSSFCLSEDEFRACLSEVNRVLKRHGKFFSYTPGKRSDAFLNHKPAQLLDSSTISGIYRKNSPYYGNNYPCRFIHPEEYQKLLEEFGFKVEYLETVQRSYSNQKENYEHIVVEATKIK